VPGQGWHPQPDKTDIFAARIPAGRRTQLGNLPYNLDASVYPFRALAKCLEGSQHVVGGTLQALNQGDYGSCTGFAGSRAADITAACDVVVRGEPERWPRDERGVPIIASPDYVYGASREVSNTLGRWEGSYGGAVAQALQLYGTCHMKKYGRIDLGEYSPRRCRQWAQRGIPESIRKAAMLHPFLTTVRVENVHQAVALTQNGYGFFICCALAWSRERDADGFARRVRPGWSHAQVAGLGYISIKRGRRVRRGFLIQNSWGRWNSGSTGTVHDMPVGAYFIGWHDMEVALRSGDCYALADYQGFPARYQFQELGW
tara:strand:- start:3648 stop:4595 length:948 start_codon:yes stop_codon:yes gene_type:complete